jgi:hypothetical protein
MFDKMLITSSVKATLFTCALGWLILINGSRRAIKE